MGIVDYNNCQLLAILAPSKMYRAGFDYAYIVNNFFALIIQNII